MAHVRPRTRWFAALGVAAALAVAGTAAPAANAASNQEADGADAIFTATNNYRAQAGRASLSRAGLIDDVAQRWAERMLAERNLRHNPNHSSQMPSTGKRAAAENVAYSCGAGGVKAAANRLMTMWTGSSGHRQNMLGTQFTHAGIGFAYDSKSDCAYGVQNFGGYVQQFFDVPRTHQFYSHITWLSNEGITTGYASGNFRPKEDVSREAVAAFLYRMAGEPHVSLPSSSPFSDVSTNAQFYREIVWLSRSGITTGYADGTFKPKRDISRDAMAAFLYRYADEPPVGPLSATEFSDVDTSTQFVREISWLNNENITTGWADGTFRPYSPVTREATAAFLMRASN